MSTPSKDPVAILSSLVSFRSDVEHGDEHALAVHLGELLRDRRADEIHVVDVPRASGKASSYVYARFGKPRLLLNAHLDTVPPNADWSSDPFAPKIEDGRLYALGAADTKGAAAAILAALSETTPRDTGILFSGDEEFSSVSLRAFVASEHLAGLERAIVCEPTNLAVGIRHRGFVAFEVTTSGPGGHSSLADSLPAPLALLSRVAVAFDDWGKARRSFGPPGFPGMCMNVARYDGGIAFNVIPAQGRLVGSLRPPPGADTAALTKELEAIVREVAPEATITFVRNNVPFQTRAIESFVPLLGEPARAPLDLGFWTEAALFAANDVDAVVFGPGSIGHAHAPNEWVALDELARAQKIFADVLSATLR